MRRIAAVVFECPVRDAFLAKASDLQMGCPLRENEVSLDHCPQALVQIGFVTRNARIELRHELGVVEALLLVRAQVRLRAAHPKQVAMQNDFAMAQRPAVVADKTLERE